MNDLNGETYSEKLSLMLDGELNPAQEVPLFAELASNDELRTEMREAISIKITNAKILPFHQRTGFCAPRKE